MEVLAQTQTPALSGEMTPKEIEDYHQSLSFIWAHICGELYTIAESFGIYFERFGDDEKLTLEFFECFFKDDINIVNGKLSAAKLMIEKNATGQRYATQATVYREIILSYLRDMEAVVRHGELQKIQGKSLDLPLLKEFVATTTQYWVQIASELEPWAF
jgi:hypothetical protein